MNLVDMVYLLMDAVFDKIHLLLYYKNHYYLPFDKNVSHLSNLLHQKIYNYLNYKLLLAILCADMFLHFHQIDDLNHHLPLIFYVMVIILYELLAFPNCILYSTIIDKLQTQKKKNNNKKRQKNNLNFGPKEGES